jgi:hypothetical protein
MHWSVFKYVHYFKERSENLLRVALAACDARCTPVQLRFSTTLAAARDGF